MKKVWIILAIALIASMLVACDFNNEKPVDNTETNKEANIETNVETNTETENKTEIEDNGEDTPVELNLNKSANEYTMGEWNGSTYTNTFLNVKMLLPEGWIKYSNQEMSDLYAGVIDLFNADKEALKNAIETQSVFYLFTQNPNTGSNVQLMSESVDKSVTLDYYIEAIKAGLEDYEEFEYSNFSTGKATLMGREFVTMSCEANYSGITLKQRYYCEKQDNLIVSIIVTDASNDVDIPNMFVG